MSKAAHTPTPWRIEMKDERGVYISTIDIDFMIATCECEPPDEVTEMNARLIVTAVNHHQELVTRLQDCVDRMDKCRNILQKTAGNHAGNWGILDTSEARETLKKVIQ